MKQLIKIISALLQFNFLLKDFFSSNCLCNFSVTCNRVHSIKIWNMQNSKSLYGAYYVGYETEYYQTLKYFFFEKALRKVLQFLLNINLTCKSPMAKKIWKREIIKVKKWDFDFITCRKTNYGGLQTLRVSWYLQVTIKYYSQNHD